MADPATPIRCIWLTVAGIRASRAAESGETSGAIPGTASDGNFDDIALNFSASTTAPPRARTHIEINRSRSQCDLAQAQRIHDHGNRTRTHRGASEHRVEQKPEPRVE